MDNQDRLKKIRAAVSRLKSYEDAGRLAEVKMALAKRHISASTLRNYLKDPKKIETAYRWAEFVESIAQLPDLKLEKRINAYQFTLTELGMPAESQKVLNQYRGDYRVFHKFPDLDLNFLAIRTEHEPTVATFVLRYRNGNKRRTECDGLIVTRHGRMFFSGYSQTTIFQGNFKCVAYPDRSVIFGTAFIDDMDSSEVYSSKLAFLRNDAVTIEEEAHAKNYLET
jgi:hypothetical protein